MTLGDRINAIRKERGISIDELCTKSGIPKGTLSKITAGITTSPTLDTVKAIAKALNCSLDDLDDSSHKNPRLFVEESLLIKKYRTLDEYGKKAVNAVLDIECERYQDFLKEKAKQKPAEKAPKIYPVTIYEMPLSAGTGINAWEGSREEFALTKAPPRGTSFIAPIKGDSMEPDFHDGDLVFIKAVQAIDRGQIGVFLMDGQLWIKELGDGVLISHNPAYDNIPMSDDIECQGQVLGVCGPEYFDEEK